MGQRDSKQHHANRRRKIEQKDSTRARNNNELEARVPLAGYEELYEISRTGRIFSRTSKAVILAGYHHSPSIRITVNGLVVTLPKAKAIADSFRASDAPPEAAPAAEQ